VRPLGVSLCRHRSQKRARIIEYGVLRVITLGINNMHDASAALVVDGKVICAAEEERFTRIKHTQGFPVKAMQFCLDYAGLSIRDVDVVAASWCPWILGTRVGMAVKSILASPRIFRAKMRRGASQMRNEWSELFQLRRLIKSHFGGGRYRVRFVGHHYAHAASAFLCSPFDEAAILTVDGAGESETTVLWHGKGTEIRKLDVVPLPYSLGQFYSAVTSFLNFKVRSDEYKIMGLSAYGEPVYADHLMKHVIRLNSRGLFDMDSHFIDYHLALSRVFLKSTTNVFGMPRTTGEAISERHKNVAASAQAVLGDAVAHVARHLHSLVPSPNLCMAGGVAMNCVSNGALFEKTPFEKIFVQPAAYDAGAALGAALLIDQACRSKGRMYTMRDAHLGPSFSREQCESELRARGLPYERHASDQLLEIVAQGLADGKIVSWFQGRMEWGPRALGNRSFLADPRQAAMRGVLNDRIKKRESFRPFAPSVLEERARDYFEMPQLSPFMQFAVKVTAGKREQSSLLAAFEAIRGNHGCAGVAEYFVECPRTDHLHATGGGRLL